jgi:hypothetical protein
MKDSDVRKKSIKSGKVKMANPAALERMDLTNPDFIVTEVTPEFFGSSYRNYGGFVIRWGTKSAGFGEISIAKDKDGILRCDNERMSREFVKSVLACLVDSCKFYDEEENTKK